MTQNPNPETYVAAIKASGLSIYDEIPIGHPTLWIPTPQLEQLLQEIRSDTGLDIHLVMESEIALPPLEVGILLSAVKECTTNAIRHGQATHVDILIGEHKGQLRLAFTDNGSGTDDIKSGSGLSIMRERVQSVGGTLKIESALGEGFTVSLIIPAMQRKEDVQ